MGKLKHGKPATRYRQAIFFVIAVLIQATVTGSGAFAQGLSPKPAASAPELEGLKFVGPFGAEGERNPKQDTFTFKDGKFSTASCLEWGFTPAPFWTRRDGKVLHFLAELESRDHGTMRYEGVFDGKTLTVVGYWKKERWYWTVERTYRGEGRLPAQASR